MAQRDLCNELTEAQKDAFSSYVQDVSQCIMNNQQYTH